MSIDLSTLAKKFQLTMKQARFCQVFRGNASEAAREAGYASVSSANRLMQNKAIRDCIDYVNKHTGAPPIVTKQELLEMYSTIARNSENEASKIKAMDSIAKIYGLFLDRSINMDIKSSLDNLSDSELLAKLDQLSRLLGVNRLNIGSNNNKVILQDACQDDKKVDMQNTCQDDGEIIDMQEVYQK